MTEFEFRRKAAQLGMSQNAIECQVRLQEKLRSAGLPSVSYESVLEASKAQSCIEVFEKAL